MPLPTGARKLQVHERLANLPKLKIDTPPIEAENPMFTLFPEIPLELRFAMWKLAAHEPRKIS